jgi:hypothetical protein
MPEASPHSEMPTDGMPRPSAPDYIVKHDNNNPDRTPYAVKGRPGFLPGNPGRPLGSGNKAKSAADIIEAFGTEPLALKMQQLVRLQKRIDKGVFESAYERIETEKLLDKVTADVMQYRHQRLKAVEHHHQLEIIQQLQQLDSLSDEQLHRLLDECEGIIKQLPPGR